MVLIRNHQTVKWFDGYDGHEVLILQELRKSTFTFTYLLDLTDRYEFRVEVKNGYFPMMAKVIIVTCSKPHEALWAELAGQTNGNSAQLSRRIRCQLEVCKDNKKEQQEVVQQMRDSITRLRDPANWDTEDLFGTWDGVSEMPEMPELPAEPKRKLVDVDTTEATVKPKKRKVTLFEAGCGEETVPRPGQWRQDTADEHDEESQCDSDDPSDREAAAALAAAAQAAH